MPSRSISLASIQQNDTPLTPTYKVQLAWLAAGLFGLGSCGRSDDTMPPLPAKADAVEAAYLSLEGVPGQDGALVATYNDQGKMVVMWSLPRLLKEGHQSDEVGYCLRIEDEEGRAVDSSGFGACPTDLGQRRKEASSQPSDADTRQRNARIVRAHAALQVALAPAGTAPALCELRREVAALVDDILRVDGAETAAAVQETHGPTAQAASHGEQTVSHAAARVPTADEQAQADEADAVEEVASGQNATPSADGASARRGVSIGKLSWQQLAAASVWSDLADWWDPHKDPAERHTMPGLEFTQEVHLFAKKARKYIVAGKLTDFDHTSTVLVVKSRPVGTEQPWSVHARSVMRNHGTPATDPTMTKYEVCDDLPVTQGWYAWKGECPGKWLDEHLCNDDARLQIWHAYGQWSDQPACHNMFQGWRPTCRKPW